MLSPSEQPPLDFGLVGLGRLGAQPLSNNRLELMRKRDGEPKLLDGRQLWLGRNCEAARSRPDMVPHA
jgi:hypothetical protein